MATARSASQASTSGQDYSAMPVAIKLGFRSDSRGRRRSKHGPADDEDDMCGSDASVLLLDEDLGVFYLEDESDDSEDDGVQVTYTQGFSRILEALSSGKAKDEDAVDVQVRAAIASGQGHSVEGLAAALHTCGFAAAVRKGLPGKDCLHNLRNKFVIVDSRDHGVERSVIVDPHFRDHFQIPRPSAKYSSVLEEVPEVFVGSPGRLRAVVEMMADEMNKSFRDSKISLPPWRATTSLLSKWLPAYFEDAGQGQCEDKEPRASFSPTSVVPPDVQKIREAARSRSPVSVLYGPGAFVQVH